MKSSDQVNEIPGWPADDEFVSFIYFTRAGGLITTAGSIFPDIILGDLIEISDKRLLKQ